MILGMPSGSRRMPAVASEVPPEPPAEMMPPMPRSRSIQRAKASAIAVTDCAAIAGKDRARAARMHRGDLHRRDVGARHLAGGGEIDGADRNVQRAQPVADEAEFGALGVESADDQRRAADALGERNREHLRGSSASRLAGVGRLSPRGRAQCPSGSAS